LSALFAIISCLCGLWAKELAESEAALRWGSEHPPSSRVVRFSLESFGYRREQDPDKLHRVVRWIPSHLDETASFWVTRDLDWIAYFSDLQKTVQIELYCHSCSSVPKSQDWSPEGVGWSVFEDLLQRIEGKKSIPMLPNKGSIRRSSPRDPREIVF
jgi:hypothetical protein